MRPTPKHVKTFVRIHGYNAMQEIIDRTFFDLWKSGYNVKEMKQTMQRQFGTEDPSIRRMIEKKFTAK